MYCNMNISLPHEHNIHFCLDVPVASSIQGFRKRSANDRLPLWVVRRVHSSVMRGWSNSEITFMKDLQHVSWSMWVNCRRHVHLALESSWMTSYFIPLMCQVRALASMSVLEILTHVIAIKNVPCRIQIIHSNRVELRKDSEFRLAVGELLIES